MLAAAGEERWEAVVAAEASRRALMLQTFADVQPGLAAGTIHAAMLEVRTLDVHLMHILRAARDARGQALRRVLQGKAAVRAYAGAKSH
jgi:hypothetical protein